MNPDSRFKSKFIRQIMFISPGILVTVKGNLQNGKYSSKLTTRSEKYARPCGTSIKTVWMTANVCSK